MTTGFIPTPTNMVQQVRNTIEGYSGGSIRALAQDPVQNSKDEKRQPRVRVEYRLHKRQTTAARPYYLLTVTDSGTNGLTGPILTPKELQQRGYSLARGENWAAFEGQGFTEKRGDEGGSRGQGKSAFLYHSRPSLYLPDGRERCLMLYDTLLENGTYRLGVRYANPADTIKSPPLLGFEARAVLSGQYEVDDGLAVSIALEPLTERGTRIIVPYFSEEGVAAVRNGELHRWLQRCWWRAIQIGDLEISVVDDTGKASAIDAPSWWRDEPWRSNDDRVATKENVPISGGLQIKRIVLLYDENLNEDEIQGYSLQYCGVQLLRGQQWIETFDVKDLVPQERRAGFRGFAEFDRQLERELNNAERPQHDGFDGRHSVVQNVRREIEAFVREFAEAKGWSNPTQVRDVPSLDRERAAEFLRVFAVPSVSATQPSLDDSTGVAPALTWDCSLSLSFPDATTTQVNWGQSISDVAVQVSVTPDAGRRWAKVSLEISGDPEDTPTVIASQDVETLNGVASAQFGNFQIIKGNGNGGTIRCSEPGTYRLRAVVSHNGRQVASAMRRIYVQTEPPSSTVKAQTLSISVQNLSQPGERRINHGDEITILVTVTNRAVDDVAMRLDASFEDILLSDGQLIELAGVPAGDIPNRKAGVSERIRLYTTQPTGPVGNYLVLDPGRYFVRADLRLSGQQEIVANASQAVFFEVDPGGAQSPLPFELEAVEDAGPYPMWELLQEAEDRWKLRYPLRYPLYRELPEPQRRRSKLTGRFSFIAQVCAKGLIEWALYPLLTGDTSRAELLQQNRPNGVSHDEWERYRERLDQIVEAYNSQRIEAPHEYNRRLRETIAYMLAIFEELS